MSTEYESQLWKLLYKEKLTDLSQFHRPNSHDELPLFSRETDLAFLPRRRASKILLGFAIKFLNAVVAYEEHKKGYFSAVTFWNWTDTLLIPHIFVWCGDISGLTKKLTLDDATTPFAKQTKKLLTELPESNFALREDRSMLPEASRVFIAPARPPYRGFATLGKFQRPSKAAG